MYIHVQALLAYWYVYSIVHHIQVGDALSAVAEHKRALKQAEKLEQEFVALMTGQTQKKASSSTTVRCLTYYNAIIIPSKFLSCLLVIFLHCRDQILQTEQEEKYQTQPNWFLYVYNNDSIASVIYP